MRERPLIFSAPMVRAIIAGTKTQTRRAIAPDWWRCLDPDDDDDRAAAIAQCPHGMVGDRLWVRETWAASSSGLVYRADGERADAVWRASLFMPRRASRLNLRIVEARPERLHDIGEEDAQAEGVASRADYQSLWDSLNFRRGFGWSSNPFVWRIRFEVDPTHA